MTRIERIKIGLTALRGLVQLWVCYGLFRICIKLNSNAEPKVLCRGFYRASEVIMDALKRLGANEQYEELKRIWDEFEL